MRARPSALAVLAGAAVLAVLAPAGPARQARAGVVPASASTPATAPVVEAPAVPGALRGVATGLTPVVGDFDGDGRADVLMYGPGDLPDHLWLGRAAGLFHGVPLTVRGTFEPLVGDFDGDRRADVLWYAPGPAGDQIWFGGPGGDFTGRAVSVGGAYRALTGDFDGDGRTDVFWYGPGAKYDVIWLFGPGRRYRSVGTKVGGAYRPVLGDFDGDRRTDVLWYGAGTAYDAAWYAAGAGRFRSHPLRVSGRYEPVVADFDGDRVRDVLWYGAGDAHDVLWYGRPARGFTARPAAIAATGSPVAGDYDGDGRADLVVSGDGSGAAYFGSAARALVADPAVVAAATGLPVAHDFDGDRRADVLWYVAGDGQDVLWSGVGRQFVRRPTTVDLVFTRALPLRAETLAHRYDPYGYIAHAMGAIDGMHYTNAREAFELNYARGFRVFECDQVILADGTVVVAHDGTERHYGLAKRFGEATWEEVSGAKWAGRYSLLRAEDLVALMTAYPDTFFILDFKDDPARAFATYVELTAGDPALMERLLPHVADPASLAAMRRSYPLRNYVAALYQTQWNNGLDDPDVAAWVRRDRVPAVMMWSRQRDFTLTLAENNAQRRRYDAGFVATLGAAGAVSFVHTLDDPAQIGWFAERQVGVYTNEAAPPSGSPSPTPSATTSPSESPSASPSPSESPTESPTGSTSPSPSVGQAPAGYTPFVGDEG